MSYPDLSHLAQQGNSGCLVSNSSCLKVNLHDYHEASCLRFQKLPLIRPRCARANLPRVPLIYHATGSGGVPTFAIQSNSLRNSQYRLNYHNDSSGFDYVLKHCGPSVAEAYRCLKPSAYRADVFRFCALVAEGGVYLDGDILLLEPMSDIYSECSDATIGYDYPQGPTVAERAPGYQMKALAAVPQSPLFRCMLARIVKNVQTRFEFGGATLAVTGPGLLAQCYSDCAAPHSDCMGQGGTSVAITYFDTRQAAGPYSGLLGADDRGKDKLLAFELPSKHHFHKGDVEHYSTVRSSIYRDTCSLST